MLKGRHSEDNLHANIFQLQLLKLGNDFLHELLRGNKRETAETSRCITTNSVILSGSLPFS